MSLPYWRKEIGGGGSLKRVNGVNFERNFGVMGIINLQWISQACI